MIAASSVETEGKWQAVSPPQVLPKLSSKVFRSNSTVMYSKMGKTKETRVKENLCKFTIKCETSDWNICKGSKTLQFLLNGASREDWGCTRDRPGSDTWKRLGIEDMLLLQNNPSSFSLCPEYIWRKGEKMSKSNPHKKVRLTHHHNAYSVSSLLRSTGTKDWVRNLVIFRLDTTWYEHRWNNEAVNPSHKPPGRFKACTLTSNSTLLNPRPAPDEKEEMGRRGQVSNPGLANIGFLHMSGNTKRAVWL